MNENRHKKRRNKFMLLSGFFFVAFVFVIFGAITVLSADDLVIRWSVNGTKFVMTNNGSIGVGTETPVGAFAVNGTTNLTGYAVYNGSELCTSSNGLCGVPTESDPRWSGNSSTVARVGTCAAGFVVQNTTTTGVQCVADATGSGTSTGGNMTMWRLDADTGDVVNVTNFTLVRILSGTGISTSIVGLDVFVENTGDTNAGDDFSGAWGALTGKPAGFSDDVDNDTTYTNGTGLSLVGTEFNHSDTSTQASSDNSGRTYIQDILLDTFGHITSIVTATETVTDTTGILRLNSPNASIVIVQNSTDANVSVNVTYLDTFFVGQSEYANLDTDSTNDVLTTSNHVNSSGDVNVTGVYNALNLQLGTDVVGDVELNTSQVTLADLTNDAGFITTALLRVTRPNASIIIVQNSTDANISVNVTYLDGFFVGQSEYANLDTDTTNDLTTSTVFANASTSRLNVTGIWNALVLYIFPNSITGLDIDESTVTHDSLSGAGTVDTDEEVSDQVGTMVTGNTETGITVTYQDADNTLDFAVTDSYVDTTGDTMTGNLIQTANLNVTNGCVNFNTTWTVCGNSTDLTMRNQTGGEIFRANSTCTRLRTSDGSTIGAGC